MLPERYHDVPCAITPASSSKMRRSATQPSHLNSSLHPAPPRKPKASPPLIAEWLQLLSVAACSLTRLPLHMKPALAAVRRRESLGQLSTLSAAIAPNHADLLDWDRSCTPGRPQSSPCRPQASRSQFRRSSMAVKLSAAAHHPCASVCSMESLA